MATMRDAWEHTLHDKERAALMDVLFRASGRGIRTCILSGDVHVSAAFSIDDEEGHRVWQLTSSAVTHNVPPPLGWQPLGGQDPTLPGGEMTVSVKVETKILVGLITVFATLGGVSLWRDQPSAITAICVSLMATACLYRFLGGVEESRLAVTSFKAGGSAGVFGATLWFMNGQLAEQDQSIKPPQRKTSMVNSRILASAALAAALLVAAPVASAQSDAHRHIAHVADTFHDTPEKVGLLAAAQAEADVAARHADLAARNGDLAGIQLHIVRVLHAIDPTTYDSGPGTGYGLIRAASGCADHIGMSGESDDASDAVRDYSIHVQTSCQNVVNWARDVAEKGAAVAAATDMAVAKAIAEEVAAITKAIVSGTDADGSGRISWQEGEGGLAQAATHLRLMKEAEGLG